MAAWETGDAHTSTLHAPSLPSAPVAPSTTPPGASTRALRRSATPPVPASSSPRMADQGSDKRLSRHVTTDESISILDPRRFTPTLHANLVSEILALRRDQEEKTKLIESLETSLHVVRGEQEQLQEKLTNSTKETRSLKRQISLLEDGTSSALGELLRERDEAVDSISEIKKRLEAAHKRIRSQEDDSQRVHDLWLQEKDGWEDERRKLGRKVHIAESRLKLVLDEVAAYQAAHTDRGTGHAHDSDGEDSGKDNDTGSVRTLSMTNSIRNSILASPGSGLHKGHSLADELNLDDDDQTDVDGRESVLSNYASPKRTVTGRLHDRNPSLESMRRLGSVARRRLFMNESVVEASEGEQEKQEEEEEEGKEASPAAAYTDTGIQYSPPPSPEARPVKPATPDVVVRGKTPELESPHRGDSEIEANQRRKRVQVSRLQRVEAPQAGRKMVSVAAQTTEQPLSPPKTPKLPCSDSMPPAEMRDACCMVSASTQTEEAARSPHAHNPDGVTPPPPLLIPSISIQPPTSRPTTPRSPRLPQYFKHFGCQVNLSSPMRTSDAVAQTEGIQIDKRLARLPLHLQPSAISSRPTSPNVAGGAKNDRNFTPVPGRLPARNPRRLTYGAGTPDAPSSPIDSHADDDELHFGYPGPGDDDARPTTREGPMRRPQRFSSMFAGFDTASSDEVDEFFDADLSDGEYRTALTAPRPPARSARPANRDSFGHATISAAESATKPLASTTMKPSGTELYSSFSLLDGEAQFRVQARRPSRSHDKGSAPPATASSSRRNSGMRKTAMIQSGIASHQGRSRSPSLPDPSYPPFPIPTRASSRQPPISASTLSDGQRSPTRGDGWHRKGSSRSSYQTRSIRKVRSAAALPRHYRYRRHGSGSPPPLSPSTATPSPVLPPLPRNDITTPRNRDRASSQYMRHRHELSTNTDKTNNTEPPSQASGSQTTGVVDAIAQTMVGEWMLKYVRRRRSFGMPESTSRDDSSNDRHKRWVWLAPYERAILWSSRQPSSGSALMGKTGRKLTIQSVLDVKDDNPAPKVMSPVFNRSILILTPQRALKFTAVSAERHYLWLTALSFLAHSSQAVPEMIAPPLLRVKHQPLPEFDMMPRTKGKRSGIRDSIRLAKGKTNALKKGTPSVLSIPSAPSSRMGGVASFRVTESSSALSREAAEPPFIPRFTERSGHAVAHGRKRSNTGGHVAPPLSFRGFSGPAGGGAHHNSANSTANTSVGTASSSDVFPSQASSNTTWNLGRTASQPTPEASPRLGNFFDAIGTVRMEAFISPLAFSQLGEDPDEHEEFGQTIGRRSREMGRRSSRARHRDECGSRGGWDDWHCRGRSPEDDFFRDDPFRGF